MTTAKHTPGPWFVSPTSAQTINIVASGAAAAVVVCEIHGRQRQSAADAKLIAAAPALADALEALLRQYGGLDDANPDTTEAAILAREALRAAGRTP